MFVVFIYSVSIYYGEWIYILFECFSVCFCQLLLVLFLAGSYGSYIAILSLFVFVSYRWFE